MKGDDHLNNIIEIVNKIKKDPKKLKRLIEIEKIETLYQLFSQLNFSVCSATVSLSRPSDSTLKRLCSMLLATADLCTISA